QDLTPEFESILLRAPGDQSFSDAIQLGPPQTWDYQITFTGPVFTETFVELSSSDPFGVPIATTPDPIGFGRRLGPGQKSAVFTAPPSRNDSGVVASTSTITARFTHPDQSVVIEKT